MRWARWARRDNRHHERGFTLVELLGVIALLGALSGIAVVSISGITGSSTNATCAADAKSLSTGEDNAMAVTGSYLRENRLESAGYIRQQSSSYDIQLTGITQYQLVPVAGGHCTTISAVGVPGSPLAALDHFLVTTAANATAGSPFTVAVVAQDFLNDTVT